jgi:hypothetical protein
VLKAYQKLSFFARISVPMNNNKETLCPYLRALLEKEGSKVNLSEPCLLKSFSGKGFIAGRGPCPKCGEYVSAGTFDDKSAGSLTNPIVKDEG